MEDIQFAADVSSAMRAFGKADEAAVTMKQLYSHLSEMWAISYERDINWSAILENIRHG